MLEDTAVRGNPWALTGEDTLLMLSVSSAGISEDEAAKRRSEFGENTLPKQNTAGVFEILFRQLESPLIFILIGAALLTLILREWLDTAVILLAVLVNTGLGFYQEFHAEKVLEKLTTYIKERCRVIRDGVEREIDSSLLVPGDVIRLSYGARVPSDARILSENSLSIDESVLTGESLPVHKQIEALSEAAPVPDRTNMAFAGTLVVEGNATAVVTASGGETEIGKIAKLVARKEREKTPLQKSLFKIAWVIFFGISLLVVGMFGIGISRGEPLFEMLLIAAAVAVGAIPEALPIALTVILASGVERLAKKKGVMRSLAAAETLGSATVVMTDKTGTLTEADMRLSGIATLKELIAGADPELLKEMTPERKDILESAVWGTYAILENPHAPEKEWRFVGRPLEVNVAKTARETGIDVLSIIDTRRLPLLPFNSTDKFGIGQDGARNEFLAVGAPDILLERSKLSKDDFVKALASIHMLSESGARILGIARLPESAKARMKKGQAKTGDADELVFIGVLLFKDPVRKETKAALEKIESLGASVIMVTGDLKGTAVSVSKELGWQVTPGDVLSGADVRRLSDEELSASLSHVRIFARVTPEDKMRIAQLLQKRGEVVAMTGDGVNDAPSLKAVDIGVALGSGSDVAKSVADLVLLDDNFKTIVSAIEEGRRIIGNIRKTFVYLMSNCLDEVFLIGGALLAALPLPLSALQIIWVNFVTGGLPALAFAFDENHDGEKKPRRNDRGIFDTEVQVLTLGIGVMTSALLFLLYWFMLRTGVSLADTRSILFLCFATYILVVAFSFRSLKKPLFTYPLFSNRLLNVSVVIAAALIAATVLTPWGQQIFDLSAPPVSLLWIVLVWLFVNVLFVEAAKWAFGAYHRAKSKNALQYKH